MSMFTNLVQESAENQKVNFDLRRSQRSYPFRKGAKYAWLRNCSLLLIDTSAVICAWILSLMILGAELVFTNWHEILQEILPILGITYSIFMAADFYKSGICRKNYVGLFKAVTFVAGLSYILFDAFPIASESLLRMRFISFWLIAIFLVCLGRFTVDLLTKKARKVGIGVYPVYLIADEERTGAAEDAIKADGHYQIIGTEGSVALDKRQRDKTFSNLHELGVIEVFVDWKAIENRLFICSRFQAEGFTVRILPSEELPPPSTITYAEVGDILCLTCTPAVFTGFEFWVKRIFDICLAGTVLFWTFPIYLLISLLVYVDSPGPVFYKQTRIGLKDKPFQVWKFRTMVPNADKFQKELEAKNESKDGILFKIKDDPRITRVGKFLRQYSLDELPQLFNVINGDMSLVGPRPLPLRDVEKFAQHHYIRQEVLPGITGLWQISGRSEIMDFEEAYKLDLEYITNWSLWLDLRILFVTVSVVLQKSGAY